MSLVLPDDLRAPFFRGQRWKRVRNVSGLVIPPHSVVRITATTTSGGEIVFTVDRPNSSSTSFQFAGYLVTGPSAIGITDTTNEGYATDLSSPGFVRYDSGTPAYGDVWGPKHGQFTLSVHYYGYAVVGGNTTSGGSSVTVAQWVGIPMVLGKTDGTLNKGSTQTVSVWAGVAGSEADTTMNITGVYNRFANVGSGKWVMVGTNADQPYLISAEC